MHFSFIQEAITKTIFFFPNTGKTLDEIAFISCCASNIQVRLLWGQLFMENATVAASPNRSAWLENPKSRKRDF